MPASLRPLLVGLFWALSLTGGWAAAPPGGGGWSEDPLPPGAFARLGSERLRLSALGVPPLLSADGSLVAIPTDGPAGLVILQAATGRMVRSLRLPGAEALAFTPDGKHIVVRTQATSRVELSVHDLATGRRLQRLDGPSAELSPLVICPSRPLFAAGNEGRGTGTVRVSVTSLDSGLQVVRVRPAANEKVQFVLSEDGKLLATWGRRRSSGAAMQEDARIAATVQVWEVATGKELGSVVTEGRQVFTARFAPDGRPLLVSHASTIEFWDWRSARIERRIAGWPNALALTPSPDGKWLAVRSTDGAQLWRLDPLRRLPVPAAPCLPASLAFSGAGTIIACGSAGRCAFVWELTSGQVLCRGWGHRRTISALAFPRPDRLLSLDMGFSIGEWDRTGKLLNGDNGCPPAPPEHWPYRGSAALLSARGRYVLGAGSEEVGVLDTLSKQHVLSLGHTIGVCSSGAVSADESLVAAVAADWEGRDRVRLARPRSGEMLPAIVTDQRGVSAVALSPRGKRVAFIVGRNPADVTLRRGHFEVRLCDCETGAAVKGFTPLRREGVGGSALHFCDDGLRLLASERNGPLFLLDAGSGKLLHTLNVERQDTSVAAFSPGGALVAVACFREDKDERFRYRLELWEAATGKKLHAFADSINLITALSFSPDGAVVAAGYEGGLGLLWDVSGQAAGKRHHPSLQRLRELWGRLAGGDAAVAFQAMRELACSPRQAVALFRDQLGPGAHKPPSEGQIAALIVRLDDDDFDVREEAHFALAEAGRFAEKALRAALAGKPSPEVKRRVGQLLDQAEPPLPRGEVRGLRAVEVLVWIGTPEARQVLQTLARGDLHAPLTRAAAAALRRGGGR